MVVTKVNCYCSTDLLLRGAGNLFAEAIEEAQVRASLLRSISVERSATDLACFDKPENPAEEPEFFRCQR